MTMTEPSRKHQCCNELKLQCRSKLQSMEATISMTTPLFRAIGGGSSPLPPINSAWPPAAWRQMKFPRRRISAPCQVKEVSMCEDELKEIVDGKCRGEGVVELLECLEREAIMGEDQGKEPDDYNRRARIFDRSSKVFQALKEEERPRVGDDE